MPSLGALQPDAAAMFQEAFDEAVGLGSKPEPEESWRMLESRFDGRTITLTLLGEALELAQSITLSLARGQVASDTMEEFLWEGPDSREVVANYIELQMMYVSGETGEPSVETTGIIEDIVRQQVIEIVGSFSTACSLSSVLTLKNYSSETAPNWRHAADRGPSQSTI
jgi:hypothetical protein